MRETLVRVQGLVVAGEIRISDHGYDELAADGILAEEVVSGLAAATVVEDYPDFYRGPCVLVLQHDTTRPACPCGLGHREGDKRPAGSNHRLSPRSGKLDGGFPAEKAVKRRKHTKLIHEGDYVAEVQVELLDTDEGWGPYLSLEQAYKLDRLRVALRENDLATALDLARVYRLTPVKATG